MPAVLDAILESRIVAIVRLERYDRAVEVARALLEGGISVVEFTLTGAGAYDAIGAARAALGDAAHIGVGTVLNVEAAEAAIGAGAQFVVTPTLSPAVIRACVARGTPILSGALTPTEALAAHEAGADMVKLFPARLGGPQYLRDILAPLPFLRIVPTGGVGAENAQAYLDAGAVAVGIGGSLITAQAVAQADWGKITAGARAVVEAVRG
ncbi:MAG TPA: bifunctional 4-hydroxy-2-oxoglutarate aldolase/2-dehydro-3-deoxy-phosphogluconate aldolase [Roseiflexaceae bacterium]|nr:bifunctional 4-hydroxy-2-oxoglutarate aldolase/2-dehydro-3-deoxy-phosphogluconate aldolase [Roseiflexaceae bacterium]